MKTWKVLTMFGLIFSMTDSWIVSNVSNCLARELESVEILEVPSEIMKINLNLESRLNDSSVSLLPQNDGEASREMNYHGGTVSDSLFVESFSKKASKGVDNSRHGQELRTASEDLSEIFKGSNASVGGDSGLIGNNSKEDESMFRGKNYD
jgi:hypothetical protein